MVTFICSLRHQWLINYNSWLTILVIWRKCNLKRIRHVIWLRSRWRLSRRTRWRRSAYWTRWDQTQPLFTLPKSNHEIGPNLSPTKTCEDFFIECPGFQPNLTENFIHDSLILIKLVFSTWNCFRTAADKRGNGKTWSQTKSDSRYDRSSAHV